MGLTLVIAALLSSAAVWALEPPYAPLVEELESLAAGEPPILGIDTQRRAGEVLAAREPKIARRFLLDGLSRAQGLSDQQSRDSFIVELAAALGPLDTRAAEDACQTIPRRAADSTEDFLADCYGSLVQRAPTVAEQLRIARIALAAGAFDTNAYEVLLKELLRESRGEATAFYATLIDRFPQDDANPAEIRRLLASVRLIGPEDPALSRQALIRALHAVQSYRFEAGSAAATFEYKLGNRKIETTTVREALLFQIAAAAQTIAPDLLETARAEFRPWRAQLPSIAWNDVRKMQEKRRSKEDAKETSFYDAPAKKQLLIDKLSFDDALHLLRAEKDPNTRVMGLLELIDREDQPMARRKSLATEALESTVRMQTDGDRLIAQSMLTRRFWVYGDKQQAALAAGYLADTFRLLCRCEDASCDSRKGREYCPEQIRDFAEYLRENKVSAGELGLTNPSLRARLILLELEETLKSK